MHVAKKHYSVIKELLAGIKKPRYFSGAFSELKSYTFKLLAFFWKKIVQ